MAGAAKLGGNQYYNIGWKCLSLSPPSGTQRIMSAKTVVDVLLVAEARQLLADTFKRGTDEIEIVGIRGLNGDPSQVWPTPKSIEPPELTREDIAIVTESFAELANGLPGTPEPEILSPPAWTPADPPLSTLPTIEQVTTYTKPQMLELAAALKLDMATVEALKWPEMRSAVMKALQMKLGGQAAA